MFLYREDAVGDGWGGSGGVLIDKHRHLQEGIETEQENRTSIEESNDDDMERRELFDSSEFLRSSAPKVCASKSAPPLQV